MMHRMFGAWKKNQVIIGISLSRSTSHIANISEVFVTIHWIFDHMRERGNLCTDYVSRR